MDGEPTGPLTVAEAKARLRAAAERDLIGEAMKAEPWAALIAAVDMGMIAAGSRPVEEVARDLALQVLTGMMKKS